MDYPEHEKVRAIQRESQAIGEFMDWLSEEKEMALYKWDEVAAAHLYHVRSSVGDLIAEFFGIDPMKLEAEKQAMLDEIREERE